MPRPGDRAVLGDVADEDGRDAALLGDPDQRGRDLADLADVARRPVDLGARDGLHGVDDEQVGLDLVDVAEDGGQVGLGGEVEVVVQRADAIGAQPHLGRGLLAGDVERAAGLGEPGGDVEQQRRLADARLAREQHHRAGHQAAAEHPVELARRRSVATGPPRRRRRRSAAPAHSRDPAVVVRTVGAARVEHGAPGLALAAPADPLARGPAALAAPERGALAREGLGHVRNARRRPRDKGASGAAEGLLGHAFAEEVLAQGRRSAARPGWSSSGSRASLGSSSSPVKISPMDSSSAGVHGGSAPMNTLSASSGSRYRASHVGVFVA